MPVARFEMPDGKIGRFEVPEGTTPEQAQSLIEEFVNGQQPPSEPQDQGYIPEEPGLKDYARTGLDQGLQGATFGFSDEITDRLGAGGASLMTGIPYSELLKEARSTTQARQTEQFHEMPVTSIGANIAGGLLTGGAGATTKTGATISNYVRTGNAAARIAKGVGAGTASGALYGLGAGEDGQRLQSAGQGAVLGAVGGAAGSTLGVAGSKLLKGSKVVKTGLNARGADELEATAQQLKQGASKLYQQSKEYGAVLNSKRAVNITNRIEKSVSQTGKNNARLHGDTLSVIDDLKQATKSGPLSLEELDQYRQLFSDVVNKNTDAIKGANPDALKASRAIEALDDAVERLAPIDIVGGKIEAVDALNAGRAEWAKYRKFESVANIIKQADGDPNKIKSGFKRFANKPKNLRGFTEDEIATLKAAGNNTINEKILKGLGRFGIDPGNVFLPLVGGGLGTMSGYGAPSAVLVGAGTLARQGQKYTARGKAEKAIQAIEDRQVPRVDARPTKALPKKTSEIKGPNLFEKQKAKVKK